MMFGSQLRALKRLNEIGGVALAEDFRPFFDEAAGTPENAPIYKERTFEEWGSFMYRTGYVVPEQGAVPPRVAITARGINFLLWMVEFKIPEYRPG